jgi:hypothetical protein
MFGKSRAGRQDGTRQVDPMSAEAERVVPGWKNTGAGERYWQGWGIANERVINPATGRPRSDDGYMNARSREHAEYLAKRRLDEQLCALIDASLRGDASRVDVLLGEFDTKGVSRDDVNRAMQAVARRRGAR